MGAYTQPSDIIRLTKLCEDLDNSYVPDAVIRVPLTGVDQCGAPQNGQYCEITSSQVDEQG